MFYPSHLLRHGIFFFITLIAFPAVSSAQIQFREQFTSTFSSSSHSQDIASGDFNGDGRLDVVTINYSQSKLRTFITGSDNRLIYKGEHALKKGVVSFQPLAVAVADINQDGRLDAVAVASTGTNQYAICFGKGDGTLEPPQIYDVDTLGNTSPQSVQLVDVNNDGWVDLVTGNSNSSRQGVTVFLNLKTGAFSTTRLDSRFSARVQRIAMADLNGDGGQDIVATTPNGSTAANNILVALGNKNGTFTEAKSFFYDRLPYGASALRLSDLDGDGNRDIIVSSLTDSKVPAVAFFHGNGDGGFSTAAKELGIPASLGVDHVISDLDVGDVNGDGRLDVGLVWTEKAGVQVLFGRGDGSFPLSASYATKPSIATAKTGPSSVRLQDTNADGKADLLASGADYLSVLYQEEPQFEDVQASAGNLSFPTTEVNQTSAEQTVTFHNKDVISRDVRTVALTGGHAGDYVIAHNGCAGGVIFDSQCTVAVAFKPTAEGARLAELEVEYGNGSKTSVSLTGNGIAVVPAGPKSGGHGGGNTGNRGSNTAGGENGSGSSELSAKLEKTQYTVTQKQELVISLTVNTKANYVISASRLGCKKGKRDKACRRSFTLQKGSLTDGRQTIVIKKKTIHRLQPGNYQLTFFITDSENHRLRTTAKLHVRK